MTDEELSIRLTSSDQEAFTEIYNRYWEILYRHALKMSSDQKVSEDIVQDIFIGVLRNMEHINPEYPIKSYLFACVRKRIINAIRNDKIRSNYLQTFRAVTSLSCFIADANLLEKEFHAILHRELELLPKQVKVVFKLSRMEQLSHKEISMQTGSTEGTIKKQIQTALRLLKVKLAVLR